MVFPIPTNEPAYTFFYCGVRAEIDVPGQIARIRLGGWHVARLHGQEAADGLHAKRRLDRVDVAEQFDRLAVADIVNPPGSRAERRVGLGRIEGRGRCGRAVEDADDAFDDVVDVGEVPDHASVVVDVDRLAGEHGFGELEQRHVRSSPGAIDREKTQTRAGQAEEMRIAVRHQFVGALGGRIQGDRMVGELVLAEGHGRVQAIDRAGTGVNEMSTAYRSAAFEDGEKSRQIGVGVGVGVFQAVADAGLGRQVDHPGWLMVGEKCRHGLAIDNIHLGESESGTGKQPIQAGLFQSRVVVGVEVVQAQHRPTGVEQAVANMRTNKSGGASDEDHGDGQIKLLAITTALGSRAGT